MDDNYCNEPSYLNSFLSIQVLPNSDKCVDDQNGKNDEWFYPRWDGVDFIVLLELGNDKWDDGCEEEHPDEVVLELFFYFFPNALFFLFFEFVGPVLQETGLGLCSGESEFVVAAQLVDDLLGSQSVELLLDWLHFFIFERYFK